MDEDLSELSNEEVAMHIYVKARNAGDRESVSEVHRWIQARLSERFDNCYDCGANNATH